MTSVIDQFHPADLPVPDWSAAANWSAGVVPGAGVASAISGVAAMIDPGVTIEANVMLDGAGGAEGMLVGNHGAVVLGSSAVLSVGGEAAVYASDSVVNQGVMTLGAASRLDVVVDIGAVSGLSGAAPPSFANQGVIDLSAGAALTIGGTEFENSGVVSLSGGTLDVAGGAIGGFGTIALSGGAGAWFGDGVADQSFSFGGAGTVALADALLGAGVTIGGFCASDGLLLPSLAGAQIVQSNGMVTIENQAGAIEGSFALIGPAVLEVVAAGNGSEILVPSMQCFASGTAILTPEGYRRVEALRVGDPVATANGQVQRVIWVGSRVLDLAVHPAPQSVQPVRIMAGALAAGVPRRALLVSPDHALLLNGRLIPAKLLVNGATIVQEQACLAVTYHHVELARHDVLLAEDAPCESYLDTGNRAGFNAASSWPVRPKRWDRDACAPLCTTGPHLHAARARLHERALAIGFSVAAAPAVTLFVDGIRLTERPRGGFALPGGHGGRAEIRSAQFVPAAFDPASEDRRALGVALGSIRAGRRRYPPEALAVSGFHPRAAGDPSLWTDGAGVISIPRAARSLALDIAARPLCWRG